MSDFTIKDSGTREVFPSGMQRDTQSNKTLYRLIRSGPMFLRWAIHLTKGAQKYDRDNWLKADGPAELQRFTDSAARHFEQWLNGETDEDHAAAVFFNINGAEYVKAKLPKPAPARLFRDRRDGFQWKYEGVTMYRRWSDDQEWNVSDFHNPEDLMSSANVYEVTA